MRSITISRTAKRMPSRSRSGLRAARRAAHMAERNREQVDEARGRRTRGRGVGWRVQGARGGVPRRASG